MGSLETRGCVVTSPKAQWTAELSPSASGPVASLQLMAGCAAMLPKRALGEAGCGPVSVSARMAHVPMIASAT
eukprot:scaffold107964_cov31-Tisochrysis_lutea.AAC.2